MAKFAIPNSNLVIIGAWNPAIITPIWLRQQFPDLLPGKEFQAEFIAGPAASVRFTMNDIQIDPSNGRLVLSCSVDDQSKFESLPKLAAAISERLPHTPVTAIGLNFAFEIARNGVAVLDRFLNKGEQDKFYANLGLASRTGRKITHSFAVPHALLNLTYEDKPEGTTLMFNFHNDITNDKQLRNALARFAEFLAEAHRLSNAIDSEKK